MTPPLGPPDFATVVRAREKKTTGFVVAPSGKCLEIQAAEIKRVKRHLVPFAPTDLVAARPPKSWIVAVLLCPGDTTVDVAGWTAQLAPRDRGRVRFYLHTDTDPVAAFQGWYAAGLEDPRTATVRDFKSFHKVFGWDFNSQVYQDARAGIL